MSEKENQFWSAFGRWLRSDSGGRTPSEEFGGLVDSSASLASSVITPENPIFTEANSDEALFLILLCCGTVVFFRGGKQLLGLDWLPLILILSFVCALAVLLSSLWFQYVQPFLTCLL